MNGTNIASRSSRPAKPASNATAATAARSPIVQEIPTSHVSVTGGTQMRTCLNDDVVQEYIDRMEAGDVFPPIVVFQDGVKYWLADGFHRFRARCSSYAETISAEVHVGTLSDAIAYAVGANKSNGLRRTHADKQMAVRAALAHEHLRELSDRRIADLVGVGNVMVSRMRNGEAALFQRNSCAQAPVTVPRRVGADGKSRRPPLNTMKKNSLGEAKPRGAHAATATRATAPAVGTTRACPHCHGTGRIQGETK